MGIVVSLIFGVAMAIVTGWLLMQGDVRAWQFCVLVLLWANLFMRSVEDRIYERAYRIEIEKRLREKKLKENGDNTADNDAAKTVDRDA